MPESCCLANLANLGVRIGIGNRKLLARDHLTSQEFLRVRDRRVLRHLLHDVVGSLADDQAPINAALRYRHTHPRIATQVLPGKLFGRQQRFLHAIVRRLLEAVCCGDLRVFKRHRVIGSGKIVMDSYRAILKTETSYGLARVLHQWLWVRNRQIRLQIRLDSSSLIFQHGCRGLG